MSTCKIPGCTKPAVINWVYAADGARCDTHSAIGQWIPCSVAMPPIGVPVLVRDSDSTRVVVRAESESQADYHWMRIPGGP